MTALRDLPTLDHFVGNTPVVRLQRIPGKTTNVLLAKLEGNNPAGSVKDRPATTALPVASKYDNVTAFRATTVLSPLKRTSPMVRRSSIIEPTEAATPCTPGSR